MIQSNYADLFSGGGQAEAIIWTFPSMTMELRS
jgi:hypothetical protein